MRKRLKNLFTKPQPINLDVADQSDEPSVADAISRLREQVQPVVDGFLEESRRVQPDLVREYSAEERLKLCDEIIYIVNDALRDSYTASELTHRAPEEHKQFTMAVTCYVLWLTKVAMKTRLGMSDAAILEIIEIVHGGVTKASWYQPDLFERMWNRIQEILQDMPRGRYFGVTLPFTNVVLAANFAGCELSQTNGLEFDIFLICLMKVVPDRISALFATP